MNSVPFAEPNWQALYDTAASQDGLFTTRQAAAAGYSDPLLAHYQKVGRIVRIRRGIYRLVHFPTGEQEELVSAWPEQAAAALDNRRQPDTGISALWGWFVDSEEELSPGGAAAEPVLTAADFPAWLLLREPGLNRQLGIDLATSDTPAEEAYRTVHRWIDARRSNRSEDELALRKTLQAHHPVLFRYLKRSV